MVAYGIIYGKTKTCGMAKCRCKASNYQKLDPKDYIGKKFNSLTVIDLLTKGRHTYFLCRCNCGNEKEINAYAVRHGKSKTCGSVGCRKKTGMYAGRRSRAKGYTTKRLKDYTGQKFNSLTVISQFKKDNQYYFNCRCDCGWEKVISKYSVISGLVTNCGMGECQLSNNQDNVKQKQKSSGKIKYV
jgi:hypothetical protein